MHRNAYRLTLISAFCVVAVVSAFGAEPPKALVYAPNFDVNAQEYESSMAALFAGAGYTVDTLAAGDLCDPAKLIPARETVLVLPDAGRLPLASIEPMQTFLRGGGRLVALNTPMWRELLVQADGKWLPVSDFRRQYAQHAEKHALVDWSGEDLAKWDRAYRSADLQGKYSITETGPQTGQRALHADIAKLDGWDSLLKRYEQSPFSPEDQLMVFSARTFGSATHLAIEWEERDLSRWIAVVPLSKEWTQYALTPDDFHYWESVPQRKDDRLNFMNVGRLGITLAFTHTGYVDRGLKYEVGPLFAAKLEEKYRTAFRGYTVPPIETLSPGYKFFAPQDVAKLVCCGFAGDASLALPQDGCQAMHPRPQACGFDKKRAWAWEPILVSQSDKSDMRGTVGSMFINTDGPYKGGMWVSIGIGDRSWYLSPEGKKVMATVAARLKTPLALVDAGADHYAYFDGQSVRLGMTIANQGTDGQTVEGRVRVHKGDQTVHEESFSLALAPGERKSVEKPWLPDRWEDNGYTVEVSAASKGVTFGQGLHDINVWRPKTSPEFVTVKNGEFSLAGKRWRPHGVNYMPSSGMAAEDLRFFEQWLSPQSYDPGVIQRDLERCASLGFNALSVFLYRDYAQDQNLIDLLIRMDKLGMKANVSLRPGTPMEAPPVEACEMIKALRLAENDTVFAYDLAWEPQFRPFERDPFNAAWEAWIVERFGSVENAEKLWNFSVPRDKDGHILNFTESMIGHEGPWSPYVAAYRRFLDSLLYEKYSQARTMVRNVDPNHQVSFRMSMASDPTDSQTNTFVYDFAYLAGAVDVLEPEAYGRIGGWERVRPGRFTREYARWANPAIPMIWAEGGVHTWDMASMSTPPDKLEYQGQFYTNFYRMMIESGADGIFWWWYPGGFRTNENSDYGIINPDGTDRPVSKVIRENAQKFLEAPSLRPASKNLVFDRDKYTNGLSGVYKELKSAFWDGITAGETPGLRTEGTGTDSATCPLTGVGGLTGPGTYPPKYLDAFFDRVEIQCGTRTWRPVHNGETVQTGKNAPLRARVVLTNLGEASLLCPQDTAAKPGAVFLSVQGTGDTKAPLPKTLKKFESATIEVSLSEKTLAGESTVEMRLEAQNRLPFGPKWKTQLIP